MTIASHWLRRGTVRLNGDVTKSRGPQCRRKEGQLTWMEYWGGRGVTPHPWHNHQSEIHFPRHHDVPRRTRGDAFYFPSGREMVGFGLGGGVWEESTWYVSVLWWEIEWGWPCGMVVPTIMNLRLGSPRSCTVDGAGYGVCHMFEDE
jgi:hypothetical protein